MKKIISLFQRNYDTDRLVCDAVVPGAEWVIGGEGVATRKYDGVCTRISGGGLWKRHELKLGKTPPIGWYAADEPDFVTKKVMGWVPVIAEASEDRYMIIALDNFCRDYPEYDLMRTTAQATTCEFLGPKSQGNVEGFATHTILPHAWAEKLLDAPRTFEEIKAYLAPRDIEGIVWHHPDGRMVKIKKKDFGLKRR